MAPLLLIESDADLAAVLAALLTDEGYRVDVCAAPAEAVALLAAHGPTAFDLVLTDGFVQNRERPYAWIDELRALTAAPIVLCSGWPAVTYADYSTHGVAALRPKPFDLDELLAQVRVLLAAA